MSLKLTKDERYTAYVLLLAEIERLGYCQSICHLSGDLFGIYPSPSGEGGRNEKYENYEIGVVTKDFYPELWNKRTHDGGYWWACSNTQSRINALKKCIEETSDY